MWNQQDPLKKFNLGVEHLESFGQGILVRARMAFHIHLRLASYPFQLEAVYVGLDTSILVAHAKNFQTKMLNMKCVTTAVKIKPLVK